MDTKKLRQKILDLAIRGKLVPQNPNDEPASVLLKRIRAEKEQLIKEGKIKRSKKSVASDTSHYENVPFEVPESWCWVKVADISSVIVYGVSESAKSEGKFKLLRITDIQDNAVNWNTVPYTDYPESKSENYILQAGDILFARTGATVGKSYLVDDAVPENAIYASYLIKVRVSNMIIPQYVKYFFESGFYWEQIANNSVGVGQPNVNGSSLGNLWVPIPPIQEQRRIVDKLVSWCLMIDKISVNQELITQQIEELRNHILNLAISGKLVAQEPSDEPAIELLKRINPMFSPTHNRHYENKPFLIPDSWLWVMGKDLFLPMKNCKPSGDYFKYIDIDSIDNQDCVIKCPKVLPVTAAPSRATRYTQVGDILFSMVRPYLKNIAIVTEGNCIASTGFYVCSPNEALFSKYCYYLLISPYVINGLTQFMKGDNSPSINNAHISEWLYPIPPLNEQKRIVQKIDEIFNYLDSIVAEL